MLPQSHGMNQALPSAVVARSFIAMMPGKRSFQPAIFEVSSGCSRPASRHFTTLCEQGWREIGLEAGAQLLERLVLVAEEGEGRRVAVLLDVFRMEVRGLVAGPVEDGQVLVRGDRARRRPKPRGAAAGDNVRRLVMLISSLLFPFVFRLDSRAHRPPAVARG